MWNRIRLLFLIVFVLWLSVVSIAAQAGLPLVSGVQFANRVRYSTVIELPASSVERLYLIEMTLPADSVVMQVESNQIATYQGTAVQEGAQVLLWNAVIPANTPRIPPLTFAVEQPIEQDLTITLRSLGDDAGFSYIVTPIVTDATSPSGTLDTTGLTTNTYQVVGNTGVMLTVPETPVTLTLEIKPPDFNPPAEAGTFWWCSQLLLDGLSGQSTLVYVPLRRSIAPNTSLVLFQQQADGSWLQLPETGYVSADGQYAIYRHIGGMIATGTETTQQPAQQTPVPPPPDSDGDGIADPNDACPNQGNQGFGVAGNGCPNPPPDSDGDGVIDPNDSCPTQGNQGFGVAGNGCPNPPPDSDGDGVVDPNDSCPNQGNQGFGVAGNGCPIWMKMVFLIRVTPARSMAMLG